MVLNSSSTGLLIIEAEIEDKFFVAFSELEDIV